MKRIVFFLVFFYLPGCAVSNPRPLVFENVGSHPAINQLVVIADNQTNRLYSRNSITDNLKDKLTGVGIRPAVLDLYGESLIEAALENDSGPVLHLGDAADVSCVDELEKVINVMQSLKRPWALTPGNHDASFRGNFIGDKKWIQACGSRSNRLTKDKLIRRYLAAISQCDEVGACAAPDLLNHDDDAGNYDSTEYDDAVSAPFLRRAKWKIISDNDEHLSSYLVQEIRVPSEQGVDVRAILIDTVNWKGRPGIVNLRASTFRGAFNIKEAREEVQKWAKECSRKNDCVYFMAGHHQYTATAAGWQLGMEGDLGTSPKLWLENLFKLGAASPVFYMSGHTHVGYVADHGEGKPLEINVPSIVDVDAGYNTISVQLRDGKINILSKANYLNNHCGLITSHYNGPGHVAYKDTKTMDDTHLLRMRSVLAATQGLLDYIYADAENTLKSQSDRLTNKITNLEREIDKNYIPYRHSYRIEDIVEEEKKLSAQLDSEKQHNRKNYMQCMALEASIAEGVEEKKNGAYWKALQRKSKFRKNKTFTYALP